MDLKYEIQTRRDSIYLDSKLRCLQKLHGLGYAALRLLIKVCAQLCGAIGPYCVDRPYYTLSQVFRYWLDASFLGSTVSLSCIDSACSLPCV